MPRALFVALALAAILVELAYRKGSWSSVYTASSTAPSASPGAGASPSVIAAPILLVALGTIVSGRAGLVNIGQEGQLVIGCGVRRVRGRAHRRPRSARARRRAWCAESSAAHSGPASPARCASDRNVPEVLTTLLMGVVAANLMGWGLRTSRCCWRHPRGEPTATRSASRSRPTVASLASRCSATSSRSASWLALVLAVIVWLVLSRTVVGFRLRMLGRNARTAQRAGCREKRYGIGAMLVSGGFAGLAGGIMLAGGDFGNYQLVANFGAGIGFAGLLAALVARQRAIVLIFVAFLFGGCAPARASCARPACPARIADVVQGMLVLALLLPPAILYVRERRRRALAATSARV